MHRRPTARLELALLNHSHLISELQEGAERAGDLGAGTAPTSWTDVNGKKIGRSVLYRYVMAIVVNSP